MDTEKTDIEPAHDPHHADWIAHDWWINEPRSRRDIVISAERAAASTGSTQVVHVHPKHEKEIGLYSETCGLAGCFTVEP